RGPRQPRLSRGRSRPHGEHRGRSPRRQRVVTRPHAFNRPRDVRRVIDAFTDPSHPAAGAWAAQVDADRIAVTGHSFGGFTAITAVTGFENANGAVAVDDRVDAIIPIAPATGPSLLADDVLSQVDVPMLVLVGTDDV